MSCKPTYKGVRYNSLDELYKVNGINQQQKQQAQQLYSQYLNTIFPNSKVKDIVYKGGTGSQTNQKSKDLGIFFTDDKNAANIYAIKYKGDEFDDSIIQGIVNKFGLNPTIEQIKSEIAFFKKMGATEEQIEKNAKEFQDYIQNNKGASKQAIINIKNPKNLTVKDWFDNYENSSKLKENSDGLLLKGGKQSDNRIYDAGENQIVVFEPEQIHTLGSKKDIEGFKEFVNNKQLVKQGVEELFESNPELANAVYEALGFITKSKIETTKTPAEIRNELFSKQERGQISLAGEDIDIISQSRSNPTEQNIQELKELYNDLIGDLQDSIVNEITPQQKQEAQQLYSQYIEQTGKQDIEGFKEFVDNNKNNLEMSEKSSNFAVSTYNEIQTKWEESGRTKEEWDLMTNEERNHVIKNCL